jgi:hypothetical protein
VAVAFDGSVPSPDEVAAFVGRVVAAPAHTSPAAGLGIEVRVDTDDIIAAGLEWEGIVLHLAAFPSGGAPHGR